MGILRERKLRSNGQNKGKYKVTGRTKRRQVLSNGHNEGNEFRDSGQNNGMEEMCVSALSPRAFCVDAACSPPLAGGIKREEALPPC